MSFKSIITKNVVSEILSKIVSLLSSASLNLSAEQIKNLVNSKIKNTDLLFAENNDIGYCVSRIMNQCVYKGITSLEELQEKYDSIKNEDDLAVETIDMMAEAIAKQISTPLYELREIIPQETVALSEEISKQLPAIESLQEKESSLRIFNWGKLQDPNCLSACMIVAKDRANCFKDGAVRQHDAGNILRRLPYGTTEKFQTDKNFETSFLTILGQEIDQTAIDESTKSTMKSYLSLAVGLITNDRLCNQVIFGIREALSSNIDLSAKIVNVVEKIDAVENVLRLITVQLLNKDEVCATFASKLISNIDVVLTNITLIRASLIFHKIHTLQNRLILTPNTVQESALKTFYEAGGTDQMIKDHLTYMELNELLKIPTNGLSLDVVLNSSAKAKTVVQKHTDFLNARAAANKVKALQGAVSYALMAHYKTNLETGIYQPALEMIHERQVSASISNLLKKSVDEIALEYIVTLRNNSTMKSFFKAINAELHNLVKSETNITPELTQQAVCSGVVSVIFDTLVKNFALQKEAA